MIVRIIAMRISIPLPPPLHRRLGSPADISRAAWLAVLAAIALPAARASAQVVDGYFPAGVPGYGDQQGVTVTSRSRPEYEPQGVRLGSFVIRPEFTESIGFDSNPYGTSGQRGNAEILNQAGVLAQSDWSRNSVGFAATVDNRQDLSHPRNEPDQSRTDWTVSGGGTYQIGRDALTVAASHLDLNQDPTSIDSSVVAKPIPFQVNDIRASYFTPSGRFSFQPDIDFTTYRFDSVDLSQQPGQEFRDRNVLDGGVTVRYELAPLRNLVFVARGQSSDYIQREPGVPRRNSTSFQTLAGIEYGTGLVRYRALIGYEQRDFSSRAYGSQSAPIAVGSVTWTPTGLTTFTGTVTRSIEDSSDPTAVSYTYTRFRLQVDHEYLRDVLLSGYVELQQASYLKALGDQTQYQAGASVTYLINRNLRLSGTYDFTADRGAGTGGGFVSQVGGGFVPQTGGGYDRSLAMLRLQISF